MKTRVFFLCIITAAAALAVHSGMSAIIDYFAANGGDVIGLMVWTYLLDAFIAAGCAAIGIGYIFRPFGELAKRAAMGVHAETNYPELKPIVDTVNARSEENDRQYAELLEDKKLIESAKKSKDEFIANITHEMNTPLTGIIGYAELLKSGMMTAEQQEKALDTIVKQGGRLSGLISCVINYNIIDNDSLPLGDVDLSGVCEDLIDAVRPDAAKRGIEITADIERGIVIVSRAERVIQVLGNIVSNAVKYNKDGGTLNVILKKSGYKALFTAADTGIGISKIEQGRIFDRFYTVDKSHNGRHGGYGLGLATVKKICKKSGWIVKVDSREGEGTTFTVELS